MKKRLLATLLGSALLLGACSGYETGTYVKDGAFKVVGDVGHSDLLRDIETGCLYLESHSSTTALTPYYDEEGNVKGCGEKDETYK